MAMTEDEHRKMVEALDCLQEAQNRVNDAARALCSVRGIGPSWGNICKLSDEVKRMWHVLDSKRVLLKFADNSAASNSATVTSTAHDNRH